MLLFLENELLKAHFFSKIKPNMSLWYVYWPAQTNFVSNVARVPKRVAYPCAKSFHHNLQACVSQPLVLKYLSVKKNNRSKMLIKIFLFKHKNMFYSQIKIESYFHYQSKTGCVNFCSLK